jgi:hypothetical protein
LVTSGGRTCPLLVRLSPAATPMIEPLKPAMTISAPMRPLTARRRA